MLLVIFATWLDSSRLTGIGLLPTSSLRIIHANKPEKLRKETVVKIYILQASQTVWLCGGHYKGNPLKQYQIIVMYKHVYVKLI